MAHIDYVKELVDAMGDREFSTRDIADLMKGYWEEQRVHDNAFTRCTKAYGYLVKLSRYGYVTKTRLGHADGTRAEVAYWRRADD